MMIVGDKLFRRIATLAIQCGLSQDETPRARLAGSEPRLSWVEYIEENKVPGCEQIAADYGLDRDKLVETYWRALRERPEVVD